MAWDLQLDPKTHDLTGGYVTGKDEILQRLLVRLLRLKGEWFLNREAGLPWYNDGTEDDKGNLYGIFGSKNLRDVDLVIRREIVETEGVERVVTFNSRFENRTRNYSIYIEIILVSFGLEKITLEFDSQNTPGEFVMIRHNLLSGRDEEGSHPAKAITFSDGTSLQELFDSGRLIGPEGPEGPIYTYRGVFAVGKKYAINDIFTHNNAMFLVLRAFTGASTLRPFVTDSESITSSTYLLRISSPNVS